MARALLVAFATLLVSLALVGQAMGQTFACSQVAEIKISTIQSLVFYKKLTYRRLVDCYLLRIADYSNPSTFKRTMTPYALNAIIELNPQARSLASQRDRQFAAARKAGTCKRPGCLGRMFGIPIALKDNVAASPMNNTAGSFALLGCNWPDATQVVKLKAAGAIMLAKLGLSEWANYRGRSVSGWSGRNGQVFNPYVRYNLVNITVDPSPYVDIPSAVASGTYTNQLNPTLVSGSSSGSGVAAAANLATVTIGSETSGSILGPSAANGVVGIKPTVGLVSRYGVIPLSHSQDTTGPMCRTVRDAVYVLDAIYGVDAFDLDTISQIGMTPPNGYAPHLIANGLSGKTIAAAPLNPVTTDPKVFAAYYDAIDKIRAAGATVDVYALPEGVPPAGFPLPGQVNVSNSMIFPTDFKVDIAQYLAGCTWAKGFTPLKTLKDLIEFNKANYMLEFQGGKGIRGNPVYGNFFQQTWETSELTKGLYEPDYLNQKANVARAAAAMTAFYNGDNPFNSTYDALLNIGGFIGIYARARFPSITVPFTTNTRGVPVGLYFNGLAFSEPTLIELAYGYEQTVSLGKRPLPTYCNSYTC